jgi:hypothetical protein
VECNIGARCIGIRAAEASVGARCIGIPAIEAPCPLICAVAGETAKTHGTTQLRRMNFFEFITLGVSKIKRRGHSGVTTQQSAKGNAIVTFSIAALSGVLCEDVISGSARVSRVMPVRLGLSAALPK